MLTRLFGCITTAAAASLLAQQPPAPVFRSNVDVVRVEVTVLDRDRRPVPGLAEKDFTVLVNGVRQPIVAFQPVEIPSLPPATAPWMREVSPDVRTNTLDEPRLFLIIMDDATTNADPYFINNAKAVANRIIDEMLPSDLASVIFTMDNSHAQELTGDRRLLRAAVEHFTFGFSGSPIAPVYAMRTLSKGLEILRGRPSGRAAIMLLSANALHRASDLRRTGLVDTEGDLLELRNEARFSAIPIHGFNIAGLVAPNSARPDRASGIPAAELRYTDESAKRANESFRTIARLTGGRAVVDDNDPARMVPAVFVEMRAYYTLAYRATYPVRDGKHRRLQIQVDHDDAAVMAPDRIIAVEQPRANRPSDPSIRAVADVLPSAELPMAVTMAPIAMKSPSRKAPQTGLLATVRVLRTAVSEPSTDAIAVTTRMYTPEGKELRTASQTARLTLQPGDGDTAFDVVTPIAIKPGRYSVRVSAHSAGLDKTGSVYTDVTVPDFSRERLAMSGLLVWAEPATLAAPRDAFAHLVPVVPTADREFATTQRAGVFARVYQRLESAAPVEMRMRIVDAQNTEVAARSQPIDAARFASGEADDAIDLPVSALAPGSYLASFTATLRDGTTVQRDLRFSVILP